MKTSSKIHQICYDEYLERQKENIEQEKIIDMLRVDNADRFLLVFMNEKGKLDMRHPMYNFVEEFLEDEEESLYRNPDWIYLREISILGIPSDIRLYLRKEGLNEESINKLMRTAIKI